MPKGIYKRKSNQGFQKGNKIRFGKHHSKETRNKIGDSNRGKKRTEEAKKKMSISSKGMPSSMGMLGKHLTKEARRKISITKVGRKASKETRLKMSLAKNGKPRSGDPANWKRSIETKIKISESSRGEKGSNWKGGISPENKIIRKGIEYRLWREAVFARDNWICQKYGIRGGILHPHHIQNFAKYPELRFAIDNGITLSEKAHKEFHKKYGVNNNTKGQLEEFLERYKKN